MEIDINDNELIIKPKDGKQLNVEVIDGKLIITES